MVTGSINKNKIMTKKKRFLKRIYWLKDAGIKAFVVLLIVAAGFYTLASISWPADDPNVTTGIVGMFVGESATAYGSSIDYDTANSYCATGGGNLEGSHICTPSEMNNSYNHGTAGISAIYTYNSSPTLWINSGPPGYTANANDCKGWTAINSPLSNPNYGTVWNFPDQYGGLLPCKTGKRFACCK